MRMQRIEIVPAGTCRRRLRARIALVVVAVLAGLWALSGLAAILSHVLFGGG